ncbi:MAG: 50S ribosomal protein L11 methyltransferase [Oscillospiraceae bacterium]|nr:50S ribosomal protein L11 methyltransferase [Oscillospiraceae bacterium]
MEWIEVTVNTSHDKIEALTDRLVAAGVEGIVTEDEEEYLAFLRENQKYWDYVDEDFRRSITGLSRVKFYLPGDGEGKRELRRLEGLFQDLELRTALVRDEDWENNWKQYYKPIRVGRRLLIVPQWEKTPPAQADAVVLRLDPGLIFGTGSHATTRMCLEAVEEFAAPEKTVLDLGCGSGILAIAALLYGCSQAVCVDIDDKAPDVVAANGALNGLGPDRLRAFCGDVTAEGDLTRRLRGRQFEIVTANIVADVIKAIAPKAREYLAPGGVFITSGIIDGREDEVRSALEAAGFAVTQHKCEDSTWHCFVCR